MRRTKRKARVFFREWREYRGMTQERAAELLNIDRTSLSRIERGRQIYSEPVIEGMAEAYGCDARDLFTRNPNDPEGLWSVLETFPPEKRPEAIAVLKAMRDTGAGGG
jgi:transcriptional regulator with XRE-family HTH domain